MAYPFTVRYLLSLDESLGNVANIEYYALSVAPVPLLLPRLLIHAVKYINKVSRQAPHPHGVMNSTNFSWRLCVSKVSPDGSEKLFRVFVALQQTVPILLDGMGPNICRVSGITHDLVCTQWDQVRD